MRCHFHVPVHKEQVGGLATTRDQMLQGLRPDVTNCLEIETYTWDVNPVREGELLDSLEAEYRFVLDHLAAR